MTRGPAGGRWAALLAVVLALAACGSAEDGPGAVAAPSSPPVSRPAGPPVDVAPPAAGVRAVLQAAPGGDGDSWRDTTGVEYRLGMVDAPETGGCYGAEATQAREALTANGFTVHVYARDQYGRNVAVVTAADGTIINVDLARRGLVDDRYLAQFRFENASLAMQLDQAFAAAKGVRAGLWGAC